jgi:putative aldouronate transport system permease protein
MLVSKNKISIAKILINTFFILMSISFIIPMLAIISISMSNELDMAKKGYSLIPRIFDFTGYKIVFDNPTIVLDAYKVTIITSVVGLLVFMLIGSMVAYAISRPEFKFKRHITFYMFFTMLFNGGLVPYYLLMSKYLHLNNTYWALILPMLGNVWYVFLMRTYFQQLPAAIMESASIDGASEFRVYAGIVLPLSIPVLATVGLLQLLVNWNQWFNALLFIDNQKLLPLQYLLQVMLRNMQVIVSNMDRMPTGMTDASNMPVESTRMAMCIVAAGPMLVVFPFFQKYFVKGLTVGSVKG